MRIYWSRGVGNKTDPFDYLGSPFSLFGVNLINRIPMYRRATKVFSVMIIRNYNIYRMAPTVQGTNSSSPIPKTSDFDCSPEAHASIFSKISFPTDSTVASPSTMRPQLISISDSIRLNMGVFVASFKLGTGFPP